MFLLVNSTEQCYQYSKALFENEDDLANEIPMLTDPYECKRLAADLETTEEWVQKRDEVMSTIIKEKFTQNDDMRDILLNTGNSVLYEAMTDQYWGIRSTLFAKSTYQETGKGQNRLGLMLMALRTELGGAIPEVTSPVDENSQTAAPHADGTDNPLRHKPSQPEPEAPIQPEST